VPQETGGDRVPEARRVRYGELQAEKGERTRRHALGGRLGRRTPMNISQGEAACVGEGADGEAERDDWIHLR
jgi:hypothetical protein